MNKQEKGGVILFVYGTMKRGHRNHWRIQGSEFLGKGRLDRGGVIYPAIHHLFPYLFLDEESNLRCGGEVYRVGESIMTMLDTFEGLKKADGGTYERKTLPVVLESGETVDAQVYVAREGLEDIYYDEGFPLPEWTQENEALGEKCATYLAS